VLTSRLEVPEESQQILKLKAKIRKLKAERRQLLD